MFWKNQKNQEKNRYFFSFILFNRAWKSEFCQNCISTKKLKSNKLLVENKSLFLLFLSKKFFLSFLNQSIMFLYNGACVWVLHFKNTIKSYLAFQILCSILNVVQEFWILILTRLNKIAFYFGLNSQATQL